MKVFLGADHRGVVVKAKIVTLLQRLGHEAVDLGSHDENCSCDYPKYSFLVGNSVVKNKDSRGILICLSGIGHSIAANKVKGVYAALCYTKEAAVLSRQHNNANVLILGSNFISEKTMFAMVKVWLETPFEGGRHLRRIDQVKAMERKVFKSVK